MKIKILSGVLATAFLLSPALAAEETKKSDSATAEVAETTKETAAAVKLRESAAASSRKNSAAARVSIAGAMPIRSSTAPTPIASSITPKVVIEEVECGIGEYSKLGKCTPCEQKNNPGVKWANSGKDCKITECVSDEYVLIDKDKEQPKCLQKCNVWGGVASREWMREDAEFSFCGSGKHLECEKGFAKTREQTGSSGTEFGHCVPEGTMTGACKTQGDMTPGKFANGKCMQVCENGFWSGCSLQKFCEKGFEQGNPHDVIFVKDKKDTKTSVFDCVSKE